MLTPEMRVVPSNGPNIPLKVLQQPKLKILSSRQAILIFLPPILCSSGYGHQGLQRAKRQFFEFNILRLSLNKSCKGLFKQCFGTTFISGVDFIIKKRFISQCLVFYLPPCSELILSPIFKTTYRKIPLCISSKKSSSWMIACKELFCSIVLMWDSLKGLIVIVFARFWTQCRAVSIFFPKSP